MQHHHNKLQQQQQQAAAAAAAAVQQLQQQQQQHHHHSHQQHTHQQQQQQQQQSSHSAVSPISPPRPGPGSAAASNTYVKFADVNAVRETPHRYIQQSPYSISPGAQYRDSPYTRIPQTPPTQVQDYYRVAPATMPLPPQTQPPTSIGVASAAHMEGLHFSAALKQQATKSALAAQLLRNRAAANAGVIPSTPSMNSSGGGPPGSGNLLLERQRLLMPPHPQAATYRNDNLTIAAVAAAIATRRQQQQQQKQQQHQQQQQQQHQSHHHPHQQQQAPPDPGEQPYKKQRMGEAPNVINTNHLPSQIGNAQHPPSQHPQHSTLSQQQQSQLQQQQQQQHSQHIQQHQNVPPHDQLHLQMPSSLQHHHQQQQQRLQHEQKAAQQHQQQQQQHHQQQCSPPQHPSQTHMNIMPPTNRSTLTSAIMPLQNITNPIINAAAAAAAAATTIIDDDEMPSTSANAAAALATALSLISLASSTSSSSPEAYHPQVEAISPTLPSDNIGEHDRTAKEELLMQIQKVDNEILDTESTMENMKQKVQTVLDAAAEYNKDDEQSTTSKAAKNNTNNNNDDEVIDWRADDFAQRIYKKNRQIAASQHSILASYNALTTGPVHLPLYNQPSDVESLHKVIERHKTVIRAPLLAYMCKVKHERYVFNKNQAETYSQLAAERQKRIEKIENSAEWKARQAKNREYFEKVFPELRKQREDKERFNRVGSRIKFQADLEKDKKMRANAVIPPLMYDSLQRRCIYHNENGYIKDMIAVHKERESLNIWTESEKEIFKKKFLKHPKNFGVIAASLPRKTAQDCVRYYYLSKKTENYKQLLRESRESRQRTRSSRNPAKTKKKPAQQKQQLTVGPATTAQQLGTSKDK